MLHPKIKQVIAENHLTASEKIDLWIETYQDFYIRTELLKVKEHYPEYNDKAYYPKNPYFPNILDLPFFNDEQATINFIYLFFPLPVAEAYKQYSQAV